MSYENNLFISELQAAKIAGISANTLRKFAEVGCLETKELPEGGILYKKDSLLCLWGLDHQNTDHQEEELEQAQTVKIKQFTQALDGTTVGPGSVIEESSPVEANNKISAGPRNNNQSQVTATQESPLENIPSKKLSSIIEIIRVQDQLIGEKDERIQSLERQISWLRERVERSEDNAEKEKLIVMSQTKTIQELVRFQEQKPPRTGIMGLLKYIGLLPENNLPENNQKYNYTERHK